MNIRMIPLSAFLEWIGSPLALSVGLVVLMVLISILTAYALIALQLIRKKGHLPSENASDDSRFPNLSRMDQEQEQPSDYRSMTLPQICEGFRNYAAGRLGLYYDIADIRRFVAGMGISKLVILQGMSGTGKTSLAYAAGEYFGNPATIVPIQPMWKERSDILGYFNEFTKRFNETTLLCKLYEAGGKQDIYITVLDEVNISRIEYYFAEFLSLLELPDPDKRMLDVVSDSWESDPKRLQGGKLLLPENMWFIGTANNDDSTFSISDKVYDRAAVLDLDRKCAPFTADAPQTAHISFAELNRRFADAKKKYSLSPQSRAALLKLDSYLAENFRISFGNRILRQIEEYVPIMIACGGSESGALDDILSRKILRKLEQVSPALIRTSVPELSRGLENLFGSLPMSQAVLNRLMKSV